MSDYSDSWVMSELDLTQRSAAPIPDEKGSDHVDISPERDPFLLAPGIPPQAGNATSWRHVPQCRVILELLSALLLVFLGVLLGATWTVQACQPKLRRQAQERRRLNEQWLAVRTARRQLDECPRCGEILTERDWYIGPTIVDDEPDDD